jgi:3-dehydroquinate synthase
MVEKRQSACLHCQFSNGQSTVEFTHRPLSKFKAVGKAGSVFLVTDLRVHQLYCQSFIQKLKLPKNHVWIVPAGETSKSLDQYCLLLNWLIEKKADRQSLLIALGGGVIGDLVGMAAATYMRGTRLIHVPTTLISQVDSAIGGKVGFNYQHYKNFVGTFYHADKIVIAPSFLKTLPSREFASGLAEIIKIALSFDPDLVQRLINQQKEIVSRRELVLTPIIQQAIGHKIYIVQRDERELARGVHSRKLLNVGHTIGHAIESKSAFKTFNHGEAVALGIAVESTIAHELGLLSAKNLQRVLALLNLYQFTLWFPAIWIPDLTELAKRDKKNRSSKVSMTLLSRLGKAVIVDNVPIKTIRAALSQFSHQ